MTRRGRLHPKDDKFQKRRMSRRKFTKKFKESAVRRLEQGSPMAEVAKACDVSSNVLNRWRQELRNFGSKAFSGYGKSRDPIRLRSHNIVFRLTQEEFNQMKAASSALGSRNLSDFVRSQVLQATSKPSLEQVDKKLNELCISVQEIKQMLTKR